VDIRAEGQSVFLACEAGRGGAVRGGGRSGWVLRLGEGWGRGGVREGVRAVSITLADGLKGSDGKRRRGGEVVGCHYCSVFDGWRPDGFVWMGFAQLYTLGLASLGKVERRADFVC
jgi:hypothetical protein